MSRTVTLTHSVVMAVLGLGLIRPVAADPPGSPYAPSGSSPGPASSGINDHPIYGSKQFAPGAPSPMGPAIVPGVTPEAPSPTAPSQTQPGGTAEPGSTAAAPATGAGEAFQAAQAAATGAVAAGGAGYFPNIIGDQSPIGAIRPAQGRIPPPPPIPPPPTHAPNVPNPLKGANLAPSVRGFKISENQSPRPQDRVFFSFDYFNNLNQTLDRHFQSPVTNIKAYRYIWGIEKTFNEGMGSVGIRLPLNTLTADSGIRNPYSTPTTTALGDLSVFAKYILGQDKKTGSLFSVGLQITPPTGPATFANSQYIQQIHALDIQPFAGYIWARDRFYFQGFTALSVPGNSSDATLIYNDIVVGYYVYRQLDPEQFLTGIIPSFETHVNTPITHRDPYNRNDIAGTPDVVNLTYGLNFEFHRRTWLTFGVVTPVSGPRPFDLEALVLLNFLFGRSRNAGTPPVVAGG